MVPRYALITVLLLSIAPTGSTMPDSESEESDENQNITFTNSTNTPATYCESDQKDDLKNKSGLTWLIKPQLITQLKE